MEQYKQDVIFLNIAEEISNFSNCVSHKVGCVLVKEGRILSTGYNGTPKGYVNCKDVFPNYNKESDRAQHHTWSNKRELHVEMNMLLWAARNGITIENSTLYSTLQPCFECSKNISNSGIKRIVFRYAYDKIGEDLFIIQDIVKHCGIEYLHLPK
jgi:dCMP deaminase